MNDVPSQGGSYVRQPDGSLQRVEHTMSVAEAAGQEVTRVEAAADTADHAPTQEPTAGLTGRGKKGARA